MGKPSVPPQPAPPDPQKVAAAQTGSNVTTAIANSTIGNANQYSPYGSTEFDVRGYQDILDPSTGKSYQVPQYNQTTKLSPNQQTLLNQQEQIGQGLNQVAIDQTGRIGNLLGQPINAPSGELQRQLGPQDYSQDRQRVEEAIYSRLNPQLERDRAQLDTKLMNEGFVRGTEGYNQGLDEFNRQANDARMQAILAGGQEQSRLAGLDLQKAQFGNQAYGQQLQTDLSLRNQPINEISALMNGGQVTLPQFQGYQGGQVAGTPIGDYTYQSAQLANQNYQSALNARAQTQAGLYGGIGSIAGAGLYGLGRRYG